MDPIKVGVIGVGHLGRYHAMTYSRCSHVCLEGIFDANFAKAQEVAGELGVPAMTDLDKLLTAVDAVSVSVPTSAHHEIAKKCLLRGIHVLVEKPITTTLEEADDLIESAQRAGVILQVGHIERFNPAFLAVAKMNFRPMFIESHRLAPYTPRGADVAVILDLMIHDIDLALTLVAGEPTDVEAAGVAVVSESEDIANARVTFSNGTVANMTASRITANPMRKMRLFQRDAYVSADFLNRSVEIYRLKGKGSTEEEEDQPLGPLAREALISKGRSVVCERPQLEQKDALTMELGAFLNSIRKSQKPAVSGQDGRRALALALRVMSRVQEHIHWIRESQLP